MRKRSPDPGPKLSVQRMRKRHDEEPRAPADMAGPGARQERAGSGRTPATWQWTRLRAGNSPRRTERRGGSR